MCQVTFNSTPGKKEYDTQGIASLIRQLWNRGRLCAGSCGEIAAARPNHYSAVHRALSAEVKADAGADYSGSNTGYEQLGRLP